MFRCVNVVAELSRVPEASSAVNKLIPQLAKAASHRHYTHHINFLESVCKVVSEMSEMNAIFIHIAASHS